MKDECKQTICVDKPNISKLFENINNEELTKLTSVEKLYPQRPLYRTEFGRMTWNLLHRVSVIYNPQSEIEQKHMGNIINGISRFFPCVECRDHFKKEIKIFPPDYNTNIAQWVCFQHNLVNSRLNKPEYDCGDLSKLTSKYSL